jgi:hypothetical protein
MTSMRVRPRPKQAASSFALPRITNHREAMGDLSLKVPDPITFATSEKYLNRYLYPRQATFLKVIFLRLDLFTAYDYQVVAEWEESFKDTQSNGITPGVIDRMIYLKANGHKWFREVLLVLGRRAGKGYVCAIAMAYVLWNYMAKGDPQKAYGIDRDKQLTCLIYAGKKEQAKANLYKDLYNVIIGAECFTPYIPGRPLGDSISINAPVDAEKMRKLAARGIRPNLDLATFKIEPREATAMSARGGAGFMLGFDEFAHVNKSVSASDADAIYGSAKPSLDQFKKDAFIVEPSSPWEMIGQFYINWQHAQEIDPETGLPTYPEMLLLQLASWEIYYDWDTADELPLFPEEFLGDLGEYETIDPPSLYTQRNDDGEPIPPPQEYDEAMKREEKGNPDTFAVERLSHWQTTQDAYLDREKIAEMFQPFAGQPALQMTTRGALGTYYLGHADPSTVNDNFGLAVGHTERDPLTGFQCVVFDYLHHWNPADWPDHTINYVEINKQLWDIIKGFPVDVFTFDQHQSKFFIDELNMRARKSQLPKTPRIGLNTQTAPRKLKVAENFKIALNQGWVKSPFYEQAEQELQFLQFKNGKVVHQERGPVQHDDVASCMFEVVYALLGNQVKSWRDGDNLIPLTGAASGGIRPFMSPGTENDNAIISQFTELRKSRGQSYSPARGPRPDSMRRPGPSGGFRR